MIESVGIVLPNCEAWVQKHLPFTSLTQIMIKSKAQIADIAAHFGLNEEKVKSDLVAVWQQAMPTLELNSAPQKPRSRRTPSSVQDEAPSRSILEQLRKHRPKLEHPAKKQFLLDLGLKKRKAP